MRGHRHGVRALMVVAGALLVVACKPSRFDNLKNQAPIVVFGAPNDFSSARFGSVVAAFSGELANGTKASRVIVSGGNNTSFAVYSVWNGGLDLGGPVFEGCNTPNECSGLSGYGTAFAGMPAYTTASDGMQQHMCVLMPVPGYAGSPQVLCETRPGMNGFEPIATSLTAATQLGAAAVGLGAGNPVGLALLGAPGISGGRGGVFVLTGTATSGGNTIGTGDELDLTAANLTGTANAGKDVAVARVGADTWVAVAAPGMHRVVVADLSNPGAGVATTVLACLDTPTGGPAGFGSDVDIGDVDGDGMPDVVVGADTASTPATVYVFSGASFGGAVGCASPTDSDDPAPMASIDCTGPLDGMRQVDCAGSAFGEHVALGDLNANGHDEVLIAAPEATVEGKVQAGAVYVMPFMGSGSTWTPDTANADVLIHSSPASKDELGASLTTVQTDLESTTPRDEPVAGMPGTDAFAIFLCSGIDGDTTAVGPRCIP